MAATHATGIATETTPDVKYTRCGTMEYVKWMEAKDPTYASKLEAAEKLMNDWQNAQLLNKTDRAEATEYVIPIVVHVVYNTSAEKITTGEVARQVAILNNDYNRLNSDTTLTPSAFKPVASRMHVTFCLADKDPSNNPTSGIVYKHISGDTFFTNDDKVKFTSQGGDDAWDVNKYLNIWVCNLGGGLLGYGAFPTSPLTGSFGVVILYSAFGDSAVISPYNKGRTCTHEIGHCFNLHHVWGDDGGLCPWSGGADDGCADTPPQANSTFGCPTFPHTDACSPSSPGIMFENFLDYTDDPCMNIFTQCQAGIAAAAINGPLASLLTSNVASCTPIGIKEVHLSDEVKIFPNPTTGIATIDLNLKTASHITIQVYNIMGQTIQRWEQNNFTTGSLKVNLSSQPNGLYFVKVSDGTSLVVKKLMVNR